MRPRGTQFLHAQDLRRVWPIREVTTRAVKGGIDQIGITGKNIEMVKLVGPASKAADVGQLPVVLGFNAVLGPVNLLIGVWVATDAGQDGLDGLLYLVQVLVRPHRHSVRH